MAFAPPPDAKGPLNRYRVLSPNAAVRVSPLCFGAMNLGTAWSEFMASVDKDAAFELLDYFYDQGGNFIDVFLTGLR
jgi:aryl-alcohol dehydrogenase-like predicted oxidoreductase